MSDRCKECGRKYTTWHKREILDAIHRWNRRNGGPPKMRQWLAAAPDHPSGRTVQDMFGSWNAAIEEAGFQAVCEDWTREATREALSFWIHKHGRVPKSSDWGMPKEPGEFRPSRSTVKKLWGSWHAFIRSAGLEPVGKNWFTRTPTEPLKEAA